MALEHAEKLIQAARLAFEGTDFECADLLCKRANQLARKSIAGAIAKPDLMKRIDILTLASLELQSDLATARRAGLSIVREIS